MKSWTQIFIFSFLLSLLSPALGFSQSAQMVELKEVRSKIEKEQERLELLSKNQSNILKSINQLLDESTKIAKKKSELLKSLRKTEYELDNVRAISRKLDSNLKESRTSFNKRVVAVYQMHKRTTTLDYLFTSETTTQLLKRAHFISLIAQHDKKRLDKLVLLESKLNKEKTLAQKLKKRKDSALKSTLEFEQALLVKQEKQSELLQESKRQAKLRKKSLEKLKSSASKLEKVIAKLTGSEDRSTKVTKLDTKEYQGPGLGRLKGKLEFPVAGKVIRRFGKQHHEEFEDFVFVKGFEVAANTGAKVRAVAPGKVILNQILPGYGNVVIVDHGKRFYTLYCRLASSVVSVGEIVEAGRVVAVLGQTDPKGRNFYFELRKRGKAIDPSGYFAGKIKYLKASKKKG